MTWTHLDLGFDSQPMPSQNGGLNGRTCPRKFSADLVNSIVKKLGHPTSPLFKRKSLLSQLGAVWEGWLNLIRQIGDNYPMLNQELNWTDLP